MIQALNTLYENDSSIHLWHIWEGHPKQCSHMLLASLVAQMLKLFHSKLSKGLQYDIMFSLVVKLLNSPAKFFQIKAILS